MSDADGVNQVEPVEGQPEIPSPDQTDNVEDFDKALANERGNISKSVREDDYFQERADELSDNKSPDEIRDMYDQLGDPTDKEDAYKDAVLGDHPDWTDEQRSETIESAKSDWENDVATREIYAMAMENHGEELTEADKTGENVGDEVTDTDKPEDSGDETGEDSVFDPDDQGREERNRYDESFGGSVTPEVDHIDKAQSSDASDQKNQGLEHLRNQEINKDHDTDNDLDKKTNDEGSERGGLKGVLASNSEGQFHNGEKVGTEDVSVNEADPKNDEPSVKQNDILQRMRNSYDGR